MTRSATIGKRADILALLPFRVPAMEPPYGAHINQIIESNKQIIYLQIERCKNMLTMSCFSLVYLVAVFRLLQVADFSISAFCALGQP